MYFQQTQGFRLEIAEKAVCLLPHTFRSQSNPIAKGCNHYRLVNNGL